MIELKRVKRPCGPVIRQNVGKMKEKHSLEYLTYPGLESAGMVNHLFTTRTGGVSKGMYEALNLSFTRGDDPDAVLENFRRVAEVMGCGVEDMVCTDQTHTTNIRLITEEDRGKGILRPRDYKDIDGMVTNVEGIVLAAFFADCVPLYFVDPVHRAIGLAHSGWRGTVGKMALNMVERMREEFGSRPEEMLAAVGPSICRDCYEVSEDVALYVRECFYGTEAVLEEIHRGRCYAGEACRILAPGRTTGKYQLDLWLANLVLLRQAGIPLMQIEVTDICTCHNPEYLFSHRASKGQRGNLGAFISLINS